MVARLRTGLLVCALALIHGSFGQMPMPDALRNDLQNHPKRAYATLNRKPALARSVFKDGNETPLHLAAGLGRIETVRLLIAQGADLNARCYNDFTPLHLVESASIATILVRAGANLNLVSVAGTPMQFAAEYVYFHRRDAEAVPRAKRGTRDPDGRSYSDYRKWEAEKRAIVDVIRMGGQPLDTYSALCLKKGELVRAKIRARPAEARAIEVGGRTLLHLAAGVGDVETAKLLLSIGMNVDTGDIQMKFGGTYTPLVEASGSRQVAMVRFLCENGADPNKMQDMLNPKFENETPEIRTILLRYSKLRKTGRPESVAFFWGDDSQSLRGVN